MSQTQIAQGISIIENSRRNEHQLSHSRNENCDIARESVAFGHVKNSRTAKMMIYDISATSDIRRDEHWINHSRRNIRSDDRKNGTMLHQELRLDEFNEMQIIGHPTQRAIRSRSTLHNGNEVSKVVSEVGEILLPELTSTVVLRKHNCSEINESTRKLLTSNVDKRTTLLDMKKINTSSAPEQIDRNIKMRRNPVRGTKKKFDDLFVRPRLLSTKRRGNNDAEYMNQVANKKQTKLTNIPYMNTRSVTKKLYNIGANHQSPSLKDEIEWREWPIHGMHERPIYHPQVGLAVECLGSDFISTDGTSYQEVTELSKMAKLRVNHKSYRTSTHIRASKKKQYGRERHIEDTFENCMHDSLHSVLAYAAQIKKPLNKKLMSNHEHSNEQDEQLGCLSESIDPDIESSKLHTIKPPLNLKCMKDHAKLQRVLKYGSKNTLILLKTSDLSLGNERICNDKATSHARIKDGRISDHSIHGETPNSNKLSCEFLVQKTSSARSGPIMENSHETSIMSQPSIQNDHNSDPTKEIWLQELISDTAVLYCTAIGTHQDDFVTYLDSLDAPQCIDWIESGY